MAAGEAYVYAPADVHAALTEAFLEDEGRPIPHILRLPLDSPTVKLVDLTSELHREYPPASNYTPEASRETQKHFLEAGQGFFRIRLLGGEDSSSYLFGRPYHQRQSAARADSPEGQAGVPVFAAADCDNPDRIIAVTVNHQPGDALELQDITSISRRWQGAAFHATHHALKLLHT